MYLEAKQYFVHAWLFFLSLFLEASSLKGGLFSLFPWASYRWPAASTSAAAADKSLRVSEMRQQ